MKDLNKDLNNMSDLNKDLNKDVNRDNTTPVNETGNVRLYKNNNYDFQYGKFYTVKDIGRVLKVPDIELNDVGIKEANNLRTKLNLDKIDICL